MMRSLKRSFRFCLFMLAALSIFPGILLASYAAVTKQNLEIWVVLLIAVSSLIVAWLGAEFLIVRRVNTLINLSKRLSSGELAARSNQIDNFSLLGELAQALNQMAASLEERSLQLQQRGDEFAEMASELATQQEHRMKLHEQTKSQLQKLSALHQIDLAITSSLDIGNTLQVLLDQVVTQLGVDAACVLVHNIHEQTLEFTTSRGFTTDALRHTRLRFGEGLAGQAALEQRTVHIPDLNTYPTDFLRSPSLAAEGFVTYYAAPLVSRGQVKGVLEIFQRSQLERDHEWLDFLEALASQAAIAIENSSLFNDLQRSNIELNLAYDSTLNGWSRALDLRDRETEDHTQRVTQTTLRLARAMSVDEPELVQIRRGALLHDIGKLGIPDSILLKPGPLNEEERDIIQKHPMLAFEMLAPISYLRPALDIPYCHHEKWDGSGYPRGLKGEQIPLAARIFAVVDVWDALISDRPYKKSWPKEKVRAHLQEQAGQHFDPRVVDAFITLLNDDDDASKGGP